MAKLQIGDITAGSMWVPNFSSIFAFMIVIDASNHDEKIRYDCVFYKCSRRGSFTGRLDELGIRYAYTRIS